MVVNHNDMANLGIDMGYGLMIREMTVSIRSSPVSIWDIFSLCCHGGHSESCVPQYPPPMSLIS